MATHNKLVRDKIPQIIEANGEHALTRILEDDEYKAELIKKLGEECAEFTENPSAEELADVREVVNALESVISTPEEVARIQDQKASERGTFKDRIYLIETTE